jgi:hypothetical protein
VRHVVVDIKLDMAKLVDRHASEFFRTAQLRDRTLACRFYAHSFQPATEDGPVRAEYGTITSLGKGSSFTPVALTKLGKFARWKCQGNLGGTVQSIHE